MEIEKLTFLAVALCQTESGDRVLCLVSIGKVGALSLVGTWQRQNSFS